MTRYSLIFVAFLFSANVFSRSTPPKIPFKNLSYPIDNVTDCWTYSQTLASMKNGSVVCPSKDIVFYSDSNKAVMPVINGLVAGVHQVYDNWIVVVKHKDYYFSYFGLSQVLVNKGDSVCTDIMLGYTKYDETINKYAVGLQLDTKEITWNPESIFGYKDAGSTELSATPKAILSGK